MEEPIKTTVELDPNHLRVLCRKANHPETREKSIKAIADLFTQLSEYDLGMARQIIQNVDY